MIETSKTVFRSICHPFDDVFEHASHVEDAHGGHLLWTMSPSIRDIDGDIKFQAFLTDALVDDLHGQSKRRCSKFHRHFLAVSNGKLHPGSVAVSRPLHGKAWSADVRRLDSPHLISKSLFLDAADKSAAGHHHQQQPYDLKSMGGYRIAFAVR